MARTGRRPKPAKGAKKHSWQLDERHVMVIGHNEYDLTYKEVHTIFCVTFEYKPGEEHLLQEWKDRKLDGKSQKWKLVLEKDLSAYTDDEVADRARVRVLIVLAAQAEGIALNPLPAFIHLHTAAVAAAAAPQTLPASASSTAQHATPTTTATSSPPADQGFPPEPPATDSSAVTYAHAAPSPTASYHASSTNPMVPPSLRLEEVLRFIREGREGGTATQSSKRKYIDEPDEPSKRRKAVSRGGGLFSRSSAEDKQSSPPNSDVIDLTQDTISDRRDHAFSFFGAHSPIPSAVQVPISPFTTSAFTTAKPAATTGFTNSVLSEAPEHATMPSASSPPTAAFNAAAFPVPQQTGSVATIDQGDEQSNKDMPAEISTDRQTRINQEEYSAQISPEQRFTGTPGDTMMAYLMQDFAEEAAEDEFGGWRGSIRGLNITELPGALFIG